MTKKEKIELKKLIYDYTLMLNRELPRMEHLFSRIKEFSNPDEFGGLQELIDVINRYNNFTHML